jgi:Na+/H+ antiporter NhaD/arsenite permease-like protein
MVTDSRFTDLGTRQQIGLVLGPSLFAAVLLFPPFDVSPSATAALASTLWIAAWWVTEAIPIPATSLLPIVLFPLTGVVDAPAATAPYADPVVFLLLGGFLLALGIERWGLHRRIALTIVSLVGVQSDRLLLGFMAATRILGERCCRQQTPHAKPRGTSSSCRQAGALPIPASSPSPGFVSDSVVCTFAAKADERCSLQHEAL